MRERPSEKIVYVRYGFYATDLFEGWPDYHRYDIDASAERYKECCTKALSLEYPDAEIEVMFASTATGTLPSSIESKVLKGTYLYHISDEEVKPDYETEMPEEVENVDLVCHQIYEETMDDWIVELPRYSLEDISKYTGMPIPILWWACERGRLESAEKSKGQWGFFSDTLEEVRVNTYIFSCRDMLKSSPSLCETCFCSLTEIQTINTTQLSSECEVLILAEEGFGNPLLGFDNTLLSISSDTEVFLLSVENFALHQVVHKWAYDIYVRGFAARMERKKVGICELTEFSHQGSKPNVESFKVSVTCSRQPERSLQSIVSDFLGKVKEQIEGTEVVLSGGPEWKESYEKDEVLFCQEVLHPLLEKMVGGRVSYTHGVDEWGRDFVVDVRTPFGNAYYGVQAKKGPISGGAHSLMSNIIDQLKLAFEMPYHLPNGKEVYITAFIVATSGHFTSKAKDQITKRMPQSLKGSVNFWDQDDIRALIRKYYLE